MSARLHLPVRGVPREFSSRCELAEAVPHHVLCHQHRNVLPAVVYLNRETDKFGHDHGPARPGLDRTTIILGCCLSYLFRQMRIDERAFSNTTWHCFIPYLRLLRRRMFMPSVRLFERVLAPFVGVPHGLTG